MRKNSLSKEKDILRALRGKPVFSRYLTIKIIKNPKNKDFRFTVIVSKKVIKLAVDRNKFKRRVKSIIEKHKDDFNKKVDFVVIAKKGSGQATFVEIQNDLIRGFKKLKLV